MLTFLKQLGGMINIALPAVILYFIIPGQIFNPIVITLYSLAIGAWVGYVHYKQARVTADSLQFEPARSCMVMFEKEITKCGMNLEDVRLRYAYTGGAPAMTMFDTVIIDPTIWKGIANDSEFERAKTVIAQQVAPTIPENKKAFVDSVSRILIPQAQLFFFRRQLGHRVLNTSSNYVLGLGICGALTAWTSFTSAAATFSMLGPVGSLVLAIVTATVTDSLFSYLNNMIVKTHQEKKADLFALEHSSKEEILAAADFLEKYEPHAQELRNSIGGLNTILPVKMIAGAASGTERAKYLRNLASR